MFVTVQVLLIVHFYRAMIYNIDSNYGILCCMIAFARWPSVCPSSVIPQYSIETAKRRPISLIFTVR